VENKEPKIVTIKYPIVPASVFKHHTDDLESRLAMLISQINESDRLEPSEFLSHSCYLTMLSNQITSILMNYQGDLIHAYTPTEND
jgi:hypothetical protein